MTDDAAPITQIGATVVIQGAALPLLYRATLALIQRRHRDGLAPPPLLYEATQVLYRAMSRSRHELARTAATTGSASPKSTGVTWHRASPNLWLGEADNKNYRVFRGKAPDGRLCWVAVDGDKEIGLAPNAEEAP